MKTMWTCTKLSNGDVSVQMHDESRPFNISGIGHLSDYEIIDEIQKVIKFRTVRTELTNLDRTLLSAHNAINDMRKKPLVASRGKLASPPALGEALISLFAPKKFVKAQLGDLQEMFETNQIKFGADRASRLYWYEVARSIGPLMFNWLKRIGFVAFIIEYGRAKLGL